MSRYAWKEIVAQETGWNAKAEDNFRNIFNLPFPLMKYADIASLPAANQYDFCLAIVEDYDGNGSPLVYWSNGTTWAPLGADFSTWGATSFGTYGASASDYLLLAGGGASTANVSPMFPYATILEEMIVEGTSVTGTVTFEVRSGGALFHATSSKAITVSGATSKVLNLVVPPLTRLQLYFSTATASGVTNPTIWLTQRRRYA